MQKMQIAGAILIGKVVVVLGDVVRCSGRNKSESAWHAYE
jgi:hypothetical protein